MTPRYSLSGNFTVDGPPGSRPQPPATATADGAAALSHACEPSAAGDATGTPTGTRPAGTSTARLIGIDAARGVALLGMMAVHTLDSVDRNGNVSLAWGLASGKAAALFAVLAGVGIAFAGGGSRRRPHGRTWTAQAVSLLVRGAMIGAVGLLIGYVVPRDFAAVILVYYALLFVLAIPLLALSVPALVVVAAGIVVAMPVLGHLLRPALAGAEFTNPTVTDLVDRPLALLGELTLTGAYPALPWLAYLCVGLAVGRTQLTSRRTVVSITLIGVVLASAARIVSWLLLDVLGGRPRLDAVALQSLTAEELASRLTVGSSGVTPTDTGWWLATMAPHSATPLDLAFTIGVSLTVLGGALLLGRTTTTLLRPLAAAGSMTLTLYCLHLLMLSSPFVPGDLTGLLVQTAVVVAFALVWGRHHARGPLEDIVARSSGAVRHRVEVATPAAEVHGADRL